MISSELEYPKTITNKPKGEPPYEAVLTVQQICGCQTYGIRANLRLLLNLIYDDDDDGNFASGIVSAPPTSKGIPPTEKVKSPVVDDFDDPF